MTLQVQVAFSARVGRGNREKEEKSSARPPQASTRGRRSPLAHCWVLYVSSVYVCADTVVRMLRPLSVLVLPAMQYVVHNVCSCLAFHVVCAVVVQR